MLHRDDPKLTAFVLGELAGADRDAVAAAIADSPDLQREVDRIREVSDTIAKSLGAETPPTLTDRQRESIGKESQVERPLSEAPRGRRISIGIAASLLIALGTVAIIFAVNASNDDHPIELTGGRSALREYSGEGTDMAASYGDNEVRGMPAPNRFDLTVETGASGPSSGDVTIDSLTTNGMVFEDNVIADPGGGRFGKLVTQPGFVGDSTFNVDPEPTAAPLSAIVEDGVGGFRYIPPSPRPPGGGSEVPALGGFDPATTSPTEPADDSKSGESTEPGDKTDPKEKPPVRNRSWKRVKATPNTSRLMIGDRDELPMEGMQINVVVDGFRARVLLDCYFYNNHGRQLEGNFKLRLPDDASLYYFAFGETSFEYRPMVDQLASKGFLPAELVRASGTGPAEILEARNPTWGKVKEARIVPREKAALAYSETVRRRVDPALVEWSGAGVFNARVFPLMPNKLHRIVVGYDVNLLPDGDDLVYRLDLPAQVEQRMIDLNVAALPGTSVEVTPTAKPFTSAGRAYFHFKDPHQNTIEVRCKDPGTMLLTGTDKLTGEYFATRVTPNLPAGDENAASSHAIFLVDTSLSSNPDKFNIWLTMLETTLQKNRGTLKEFAVLFFNIESHWWKPEFVKNTPQNVEELLKHCGTLALEGATDLRQALAAAVKPEWLPDGRLPFKGKPDMFLLSDGAMTWGELNVRLMAKTLQSGWGGTLFAYKTGLTGTAVGVLEHLARETGGGVFSIVNEDEIAQAATAYRKRPWQLLNATVTGGSDVLVAGRIRSIYSGQSLLLVGRGKPDAQVTLHVKRGDEQKMINVPLDRTVESELAPRLYGQVAVGQLEGLRSATEQVSIHYARHFRVTGQTCSLLMMETEQDYQRFNIKPEDDVFTVKSTPAADLITRKLDEFGEQLQNPKAEVEAWLAKMEKMPGVNFKIPVPLQEVLPKLPQESFDVKIPRLACKQRSRDALSKKFFAELTNQQLNYDVINGEAVKRFKEHGAADALKALSSLIENNPGDPVLTRDVAFSALEWNLPGQAYPLLKRVLLSQPHQPQAYQALAQCLADLGNADLAIVYYEVALNGNWHERWKDFNKIVGVEYLHLLHRVDRGELTSSVPHFAKARLDDLNARLKVGNPDLIVTMMWNTDRTDVDLHVLEPSGDECYYKNPNTRAGGRITADVTAGFGPEMYTLDRGQKGKYTIKANYYGSDANRTQVRSKIHVTVYEGFGTKREKVSKNTVSLNRGKEMRELTSVMVKK